MKKLFIALFLVFAFLSEVANARGVGLGIGSMKVGSGDTEVVAHITIETYSRINDGIVVAGWVLNFDGYSKGDKGQMLSVEYGLGILADKKLNLYLTYGIAHQSNSSSTVDASIGLGWGVGLSYRLTKATYLEVKHRSYSLNNHLNGTIEDYDAKVTSVGVAYMF